jgi:hypothetical protein
MISRLIGWLEMRLRIWATKRAMRTLYLQIADIERIYDCGESMIAQFRPEYPRLKREFQYLKNWCKDNDPNYPKEGE